MPFSQSLAIVPQEAVACGRLYFIGCSSSFFGAVRNFECSARHLPGHSGGVTNTLSRDNQRRQMAAAQVRPAGTDAWASRFSNPVSTFPGHALKTARKADKP